ncbi:MAG: low specificity L-threonine aldolase, partial [Bacteroidaceae bacterium]|nr:low specificity L-threonine aldolase [Bacteroidaceae bacterium]
MIQFQCDYNEGAHPLILERLIETNLHQTVGYGLDEYCDNAKDLIKKACQTPDADVHLLVGGTQTNATVISSILRPYQGVVCAETGHINVHETGAIEHSGHKCLALPAVGGKISAQQVADVFQANVDDPEPEHMVQPAMVYISYPTEVGTIYTKQELTDIFAVCKHYNAPLFIDGARLGYGLKSPDCDLTLPEFAQLCDVFYIGGTKVGALFGEAVV